VVWACVAYKCQEFQSYIFSYFLILRLSIIRLKYQGVGWESIVDIVTHCGLDSSDIKSQLGEDFLHLFRPALGSTRLPIQWVPGFFPRGEEAGVWH
jgi:hypothetical protein